MTADELTAQLKALLQQTLADAPDLIADLKDEMATLAEATARYVGLAAAGDPEAPALLNVVKARAAVLSAIVAQRGQKKLSAMIGFGFELFAKFLGTVLKAAL